MRISIVVLIAVLISTPLSTAGEPAEDARSLNGGFTGDVKPVIYVTDVERSMPFYRDVLGFAFDGYAQIKGEPYYADMLAGPLKFGLHEPVSDADRPRVGKIRIYFRVEDLEKQHRRVAAWGGSPGNVVERSWMDMFGVEDPDGNLIMFAYTSPDKHSSDPW